MPHLPPLRHCFWSDPNASLSSVVQGAYIEGGETRSYRADRCVNAERDGHERDFLQKLSKVGQERACSCCCISAIFSLKREFVMAFLHCNEQVETGASF